MRAVDLGKAEAHLARLVDEAARGEPFVITRAGKPMVRVVPLDAGAARKRPRLGCLRGQVRVADDFDPIAETEIAKLFGGD
ncbi:MAG: type II toxin-antitoxin system prevent-host-death family antitoxin [Geminicoccaceae bacterium]|nr:MAG: type II toxin-antitoxin system prevent-host-death family antitoxin [Geminicoccaceae bacterium]